MAEIPEIIDLNETEEKVAKQLDALGQLLQQAEKLRRRQFLIAGITVLLMFVILSFFIIQTVAFFRTYPKRLLMREVVKQNRLILENPYYFGVNQNYDRNLVRYFIRSAGKELQRRKPLIRLELRKEIRSLNEYAFSELRSKFRNQLYKRLSAKTRIYMKEKNLVLNPGQFLYLRRMNVELTNRITDAMFPCDKNFAAETFRLYQDETALLKQTGMYRELAGEPLDAVENRLYENLLECLVCRLNERKASGERVNRHE